MPKPYQRDDANSGLGGVATGMRRRALGDTGLLVTELGYGAGQLRGPRIWNGRPVSDRQAETILNAVLDAGINFIDTANVYGRSEEFIGRFIGHRRDEFIIATKCGCRIVDAGDHDETPRDWSRAHLMASVEQSLRRLKTDRVDLLQLHNPTIDDLERHDLVSVLDRARSSGLTRFIGVSTTHPDVLPFLGMGVFDTFQVPYSALQRDHEDAITAVAGCGGGTIIRGGIAQGTPEKPGAPGREVWLRARLDDLPGGEDRLGFALRFTLSHPAVHTAIVATLDPAHLAANLRAVAVGPLPDDVYDEAKRRLDAVGIEGSVSEGDR